MIEVINLKERCYLVADILKNIDNKTKPVKSILFENERMNGVVWYVPAGGEIPAHYHPSTDDVWVVLEGEGEYFLGDGKTFPLKSGIVALANKEEIHGVRSTGEQPLVVVSVSAPMPVEMIKIKD